MTDKPIAAAVITERGRVLMIRRRVAEGRLLWAFPSGGVEAGETVEDAAVRETVEETGLVVEAVKVIGSREHPDTHRHMHYVSCRVVAGAATVADVEELAEVEWVTYGEIPEKVPHGLFDQVDAYLRAELQGVPSDGPADPP